MIYLLLNSIICADQISFERKAKPNEDLCYITSQKLQKGENKMDVK